MGVHERTQVGAVRKGCDEEDRSKCIEGVGIAFLEHSIPIARSVGLERTYSPARNGMSPVLWVLSLPRMAPS